MMNKKIALVTPTLGGGGAERTAILLANGLADYGFDVSMLVANATGAQGKLVAELNTEVQLVDFGGLRTMQMMSPLSQWLKQHRPDVLISTQTHTNLTCYAALKLSGAHSKLICREVSTASVNLRHLKGFKKWLWQGAMRWVYHHSDHVVAVSQGVAQDLQQFLSAQFKNLSVIYDPVITVELYEKAQQPLDHEWFGPKRIKPVILAVGRLTEAKNYPLLIDAFAELVKETPANLLILGEGEDRAELEALIAKHQLQDCVQLFGFDNNPFRYLARCDVYVMSSRWEGLPGALIQALALGVKAVSTDCPSGPKEIFAAFGRGTLVPVNDVQALKNALQKNIQTYGDAKDPQAALQAGKAFTLDSTLQAYASLLSETT